MKKILLILILFVASNTTSAQSTSTNTNLDIQIPEFSGLPQFEIPSLSSFTALFPGLVLSANITDLQNAINCAASSCGASIAQDSDSKIPQPNKKTSAAVHTQIVTKTLKQGSFNLQVFRLQDFLATKGYFTSVPTGYFGTKTDAAVKAYQTANGLEADGIVGIKTQASINNVVID